MRWGRAFGCGPIGVRERYRPVADQEFAGSATPGVKQVAWRSLPDVEFVLQAKGSP